MTSQADEMRERRALAGSNNATTYFQQSQVAEELDAKAGRFAKPSVVSGANPTVQYPRLPASSPWAADMVPPEEPLGYSVNDLSPTGELHELAGPVGSDIGTNPADVVETTGPAIPLATSSTSLAAASVSSLSVADDVASSLPKSSRS